MLAAIPGFKVTLNLSSKHSYLKRHHLVETPDRYHMSNVLAGSVFSLIIPKIRTVLRVGVSAKTNTTVLRNRNCL